MSTKIFYFFYICTKEKSFLLKRAEKIEMIKWFQGYILGNPVTEYHLNNNYKVLFAYGMTLISYELYQVINYLISCRKQNNEKPIGCLGYEFIILLICLHLLQSLEKSCRGEYTIIDPNNTECLKFVQAYEKVSQYVNNPPIYSFSYFLLCKC